MITDRRRGNEFGLLVLGRNGESVCVCVCLYVCPCISYLVCQTIRLINDCCDWKFIGNVFVSHKYEFMVMVMGWLCEEDISEWECGEGYWRKSWERKRQRDTQRQSKRIVEKDIRRVRYEIYFHSFPKLLFWFQQAEVKKKGIIEHHQANKLIHTIRVNRLI